MTLPQASKGASCFLDCRTIWAGMAVPAESVGGLYALVHFNLGGEYSIDYTGLQKPVEWPAWCTVVVCFTAVRLPAMPVR